MFRVITLFLLSIFAAYASAESIKCGDSEVSITDSVLLSEPFFTLKISNKNLNKSFQFSVEKDYINLRCESKSDGKLVVVILHYCGGSGCNDLGNFGIVELESGNVLLEPDQPFKGNAKKANTIMGKEIKPFSWKPNSGEICIHTQLQLG